MKPLLKAIVEGGLRSPNYFNGRLLSGEDLTQEHEAQAEGRRQLGRAMGSGVVQGLEVRRADVDEAGTVVDSRTNPMLVVEPGEAINREGQVVALHSRTHLSLLRAVRPAGSTTSTTFQPCARLTSGIRPAVEGIYLITIAPTEAREGVAPVLGTGYEVTACNRRVRVEAVEFNLTAIGEPYITQADLADRSRLRNLIAYRCFGQEVQADVLKDPFGVQDRPKPLLEQLPPSLFAPCEVPLGLMHWSLADGMTFVDRWAVRRRATRPGSWAGLGGTSADQIEAEGEARFLHFQEHLSDLLGDSQALSASSPSTVFRFLPAAGIVPLAGTGFLRGLDEGRFVAGIRGRAPVHVDGARVADLALTSFAFPAVDLASREFFWTYRIRENQAPTLRLGGFVPQACLIFASGHMPFVGDALCDRAYFDLSNYS